MTVGRGGGGCCDFKAGQVRVFVPWTRALRFLLRHWHPARAELPRVSRYPCGAWGHARHSLAGPCSGDSKGHPCCWKGTSYLLGLCGDAAQQDAPT